MEKYKSDFSTSTNSSALTRQLFEGAKENPQFFSSSFFSFHWRQLPLNTYVADTHTDCANSALSLETTSSLNPTAHSIKKMDYISLRDAEPIHLIRVTSVYHQPQNISFLKYWQVSPFLPPTP